jgi:hypothetical protein
MTGVNSAVTDKFSDPPVIMTGIASRFISRPGYNDLRYVCKEFTNNREIHLFSIPICLVSQWMPSL